MSYSYDFLSSFNLLKFDRILFYDVANKVSGLKIYPYFLAAHCLGVCLNLKDDINDRGFSRKHPMSLWFSTMLSIFAGIILQHFLIGDSVMDPFKDYRSIAVASFVWYLVFYSPFDVFYHAIRMFPVKVLIMAAKEVARCRAIYEGILIGCKLYPRAYLLIIMLGTVRGVGSLVLRNFERSIRGINSPSPSEILQPSVSTKLSLVTATIFTMHKTGICLTSIPAPILYFSIVTFMIYFRVSIMIWDIRDPFLPFENIFCTVFMGGVWDALQKACKNNPPFFAHHRHEGGVTRNSHVKGSTLLGRSTVAHSDLQDEGIEDINAAQYAEGTADRDEEDPPYQRSSNLAEYAVSENGHIDEREAQHHAQATRANTRKLLEHQDRASSSAALSRRKGAGGGGPMSQSHDEGASSNEHYLLSRPAGLHVDEYSSHPQKYSTTSGGAGRRTQNKKRD